MTAAALLSDYGSNYIGKIRGLANSALERVRNPVTNAVEPAMALVPANPIPTRSTMGKLLDLGRRDISSNRALSAAVGTGALTAGIGIGKRIGQPVLERIYSSIPGSASNSPLMREYGDRLLRQMDAKNLAQAKGFAEDTFRLANDTRSAFKIDPNRLKLPQSVSDSLLNPAHSTAANKAVDTLYPGASELAAMMSADRTANYLYDNVAGVIPFGVGAGANLTTLARQITSLSGLGNPAIRESIRESVAKSISGQVAAAKTEGRRVLDKLEDQYFGTIPVKVTGGSAFNTASGLIKARESNSVREVAEFLRANQPARITSDLESRLSSEIADSVSRLNNPEVSSGLARVMENELQPTVSRVNSNLSSALKSLRADYPYIPVSKDLTSSSLEGIANFAKQEAAVNALEQGAKMLARTEASQRLQREIAERLANRIGTELAEKALVTAGRQVPLLGTAAGVGIEAYNAKGTYDFARLLEKYINPRDANLSSLVSRLDKGPAQAMNDLTYDPQAIATALKPLEELVSNAF